MLQSARVLHRGIDLGSVMFDSTGGPGNTGRLMDFDTAQVISFPPARMTQKDLRIVSMKPAVIQVFEDLRDRFRRERGSTSRLRCSSHRLYIFVLATLWMTLNRSSMSCVTSSSRIRRLLIATVDPTTSYKDGQPQTLLFAL